MRELMAALRGLSLMAAPTPNRLCFEWIAYKGYHLGNGMNAFRLTVVGECKGPYMYDITELLGPNATIARIERAASTTHQISHGEHITRNERALQYRLRRFHDLGIRGGARNAKAALLRDGRRLTFPTPGLGSEGAQVSVGIHAASLGEFE